MLASKQNKETSCSPIFFNEKGVIKIEKCPKCGSNQFNLIDHNNWFHCWECRFVEHISKLKGLEIIQ